MKATKVTLREKKVSKGRLSLYLDFYPPIKNPISGQETRRDFLNLYIFESPKGEVEKKQNKETKILADNIRAKRQLEIQAQDFGFFQDKKADNSFLDYFLKLQEEKEGTNSGNWKSAYFHLVDFSNGKLNFSDINETFLENFKLYLAKLELKNNSQISYYNKVRAATNKAFKEKYLKENPCHFVSSIKYQETTREILTVEEVQKLINTNCKSDILKKASIFSILTGIRWSDIENLTWEQVHYTDNMGYFVRFTQQKTKGVETLPINTDAFKIMGERKEPKEKVFPKMVYSAWISLKLREWTLEAGINKKITFHCFRHTYATIQLALGVDVFTVSKMLGHKDIKTTQIYAKIIDSTKINAAKKMDFNFEGLNI